jgi:DNA-3-methyladenine glycosylase II
MQFSIRPKGPFSLDLTLQRYRLFGEDAAHAYVDGIYHQVLAVSGKLWVYTLSEVGPPDDACIQVQILGERTQRVPRAAIAAEIHRTLGLDVDLDPFYRWAASDPTLAELITQCYGMRPPRPPTLFESLVMSISAQQVNLGFATLTRSRLIKRFGASICIGGRAFYAFPVPESLAGASIEELRAMQFSWRKAESIVNLAQLVASGALRLEEFPTLPNEAVIERVTQVKGLGRWTADWLLARGLGRGDVVAAGDLGVRKALGRFYFGGVMPSSHEVRSYAARWGAFQNLTVHYLLAGLRLPTSLSPVKLPPKPGRNKSA